jgi:2-oxoglutarate ferredoxin oxidoreductase subunit alpha
MARVLMKGTEAIAEAAVQAGCKYFFGYPITPQNEIPEYMSARLPAIGGAYVQAESEVAAINMVMGGGATGTKIMTTSSSPGISLMSEGLSYIAGCEIPAVIVNVMRGGPGLGGILPAQGDYFQATKGGGNGDYRLLVLAPSTLQEAVDLTQLAFDLALTYRNPVMILADGFMGQMMEAVEISEHKSEGIPDVTPWALGNKDKREKRSVLRSLYLDPEKLEMHNMDLKAKYDAMQKEVRFEEYCTEDAEYLIAAFGTTARIARSAIANLRDEGVKVGMIRPVTLYPFPKERIRQLSEKARHVFVVEMNTGQMLEDVQAAVCDRAPVSFYGRCGGISPSVKEIEEKLRELL